MSTWNLDEMMRRHTDYMMGRFGTPTLHAHLDLADDPKPDDDDDADDLVERMAALMMLLGPPPHQLETLRSLRERATEGQIAAAEQLARQRQRHGAVSTTRLDAHEHPVANARREMHERARSVWKK